MKVMLINLDSKIPNLALHKIALYHQQKGDEVFWDIPLIKADKTYVSCVFSWNKEKCRQWEGIAEIGGSGYSLEKILPDEIEAIKPKINLGFTTRGCIRKCPFCIVPTKEGHIRTVGDIYDIWDGKSKSIILLDNNILALPEHFKLICSQLRKEKLKVDFNQGLDIRLLTDEQAEILSQLKPLKQWRFAFDSTAYESSFRKGAELIGKYKISKHKICVYVLAGHNDTIEDVLYRIEIIYQEYGFDPFIMLYKSPNNDNAHNENYQTLKSTTNLPAWKKHRQLKALQRWVNRKQLIGICDFKDYDRRKEKQEINQKSLF